MSDTRLGEIAEPLFARHETFAPRFGWLHKGFVAIDRDPGAFLDPKAPVILGVGKNMVNAIRYWSVAFKLAVEHPRGGTSRAHTASPTWEACWLLSESGADPYLEDAASLWLLHWWLVSQAGPTSSCYAPTWWIAFHSLPSSRFNEADLAKQVVHHVRLAGWEPPATASIAKDVDCLTKMYAPRKAKDGSPGSFEDLLDCPFRELGLLEGGQGKSHQWRLTDTARASLPARVIAYACLDYVRQGKARASVTLSRLANEPGSPGRAFRLREPDIAAALSEVSGLHPAISITEGVGQRTLVVDGEPRTVAWDILDTHYGNARSRVVGYDEWLTSHPALAVELRRRADRFSRPPVLTEELL